MSYHLLKSNTKVESYQKLFSSCSQRCCFYRYLLSEGELESLNHLRSKSRIPFNKENLVHLAELKSLWQVAFPEQDFPPEIKSTQWKSMGFQGLDPSTDFRGSGLFGLEQMVYLSQNYPHEFKAMMQSAQNYSFAISALNISHMLMSFFQLHKLPTGTRTDQIMPIHILKAFCKLNENSPDTIHELYVAAVIKMHDTWADMNKKRKMNVMQFQNAILTAGDFVVSLLEVQPVSLAALKKLAFA